MPAVQSSYYYGTPGRASKRDLCRYKCNTRQELVGNVYGHDISFIQLSKFICISSRHAQERGVGTFFNVNISSLRTCDDRNEVYQFLTALRDCLLPWRAICNYYLDRAFYAT